MHIYDMLINTTYFIEDCESFLEGLKMSEIMEKTIEFGTPQVMVSLQWLLSHLLIQENSFYEEFLTHNSFMEWFYVTYL